MALNLININLNQNLKNLRAKNQSAWKQAGNALVQTIGTVIGDTVGGVGMLVDIATVGLWDDKPLVILLLVQETLFLIMLEMSLLLSIVKIPIKHLTLMTSQVGSLVKFLVLLVLFLL